MIRRLAYYSALVLATIVGLFLLWQFREALTLFVLSLATAAAARPVAEWGVDHKIPRSVSLVLVNFSFILLLGFIFILIGPELLKELGNISDRFVTWYDQIWQTWPQGTSIQQSIIKSLPQPADLYQLFTGPQGEAITRSLLGFTLSSITITAQIIAILVLSIYWGIDEVHFERLWLSLLPVEQRAYAREIWRNIEAGVGGYIRSEAIQSLLAGVLLAAGFSLIGISYPFLLALFGAIAGLIPWIGVLVALIPIIWVGLLVTPIQFAMSVAYTILIFVILQVVVEPYLYDRSQFSSLLSILIIIALAETFGIIGILFAPPLAAAIQIFFTRLISPPPRVATLKSTEAIDSLEERIVSLRSLLSIENGDSRENAINLMNRLQKLIDRAKVILD